MSKKIIAGPWAGEFGWLLMRWQGIFRALHYKGYEIIMCGSPKHKVLYDDYIVKYIEVPLIEGEPDGWKINKQVQLLPKDILDRYKDYVYLDPTTSIRIGIDVLGKGQKFIKYGEKYTTNGYNYVVIHPRNTTKVNTDYRNWPIENWNSLVKKLGDLGMFVATIGTKETLLPEGTKDYRERPLKEVMDLLANSKLAIGPSSGPMHLASLCGTPHLVWTDNKYWGSCGGTNRERYEKNWNPLGTKTIILDKDNWQPSVIKVETAVDRFLNGKDTSNIS